jgi:hypothetical protein
MKTNSQINESNSTKLEVRGQSATVPRTILIVALKEKMKILIHFITEGKIIFSAGRYVLLQAKLTEVEHGERKFHTKVLRRF